MGTILVVRHGETQLNHDNRVRGWADVPLNSRGIQEALHTARQLENWPVSQIVSSDLLRTKQTAQIISKLNFAPVFYTQYLRSWNTGTEMQGMSLDEAIPRMQHYVANPTLAPEGGESFSGFLRRVELAWNDAIFRAVSSPSKAVVIVTSSRDIDAFRYFTTGDKKHLDKDSAVTPGHVAEFLIEDGDIREVPFEPAGPSKEKV